MVAIPLLWGVVTTETGEFAQSVPINLEPISLDNRIAKGQLRSTLGTIPFGNGPGNDRGAINWNGVCYRIMGTSLVQVNADGSTVTLGDVGGSGYVTMDYSFDRLGIMSSGKLYYWNGATLVQNVSPNLGTVVDMLWIDGYFMTTDGNYILVTELSDPSTVKPLKYGSAEEDPDMVTGLIKLRDEAYVCGQYTIQVFQNVGGNGFPFKTLKGATIPFGCVSPSAKILFGDSFAFVGSARNEGLGVFLAGGGSATKISSRALDKALAQVSDPTTIQLEKRVSSDEARLFVHLPNETWVFVQNASRIVGELLWYRAQSGVGQPYRLRNAVNVYGQVLVGDVQSGAIGTLTDSTSTHFGQPAQWLLDLGIIYNRGMGGIIHKLELMCLPGRGGKGAVFLSLTKDGETFSVERQIAFSLGEREKRLQWRPHTRFKKFMGMRFRGYDTSIAGIAALEADIVPLSV